MGFFKWLIGTSKEQSNLNLSANSVVNNSKHSESLNQEIATAPIPDGKYLVKFHSESAIPGECVLGNMTITTGRYKDSNVQLVITTKIAKKISREYSGLWISRLQFECDKKGSDLDYAISQAFEGQFFVTIKDGFVRSVLDPSKNWESIERHLKRDRRVLHK